MVFSENLRKLYIATIGAGQKAAFCLGLALAGVFAASPAIGGDDGFADFPASNALKLGSPNRFPARMHSSIVDDVSLHPPLAGNATKRPPAGESAKMRRLNPQLKKLLRQVEKHYGRRIVITSGCRSWRHNRRIGGARRSYHLKCQAADIKVPGVSKYKLRRYVRSLRGVGGVGTYCRNSIVHVDVGPRRSWHWRCRRARRR